MFERFSLAARETVVRAQRDAQDLGHRFIGTEHLLLALIDPDAGIASQVLRDAGVERAVVLAEIERRVPSATRPLSDEDAAALATIGIDLDAVLARVDESFGPGALASPAEPARRPFFRHRPGHGGFTRRAKKVIGLALREAVVMKSDHIDTGHILLGLLREEDGLAARILVGADLALGDLRAATVTRMQALT